MPSTHGGHIFLLEKASTPQMKSACLACLFDYHIEIWLLDDNLYPLNVVSDDIRDKLIAKGIPADEIAYIHDAKSEKQKAELFEKVRNGDIRILLGSTNSAPY